MATPPPPTEDPVPVEDTTPAEGFESLVDEMANEAPTGPQLPDSGLPEGWTMEQWQHYGEEYLRRQGGA